MLSLKQALQKAEAAVSAKSDEHEQVVSELETSKQNVENLKAKCINLKQQIEQASSSQSAEVNKQLAEKDKLLRELEQAYIREKDARQKEQQKNQVAMPCGVGLGGVCLAGIWSCGRPQADAQLETGRRCRV